MTLPSTPTVVDYPRGDVESVGIVLHREATGGGRAALILDRTAAHPVDAAWPDQGADRAVLIVDGHVHELVDCIVAATDGRALYLGSDIPVRKGTDGWAFLVAHLIDADGAIAEGDTVEVSVDEEYRAALSAGHTACHLAALALNRALESAWTKEVPADTLGAPNFDALAIETSTILEYGARDEYRVGKSLRRKGFVSTALDDLGAVETAVNRQLAEWDTASSTVRVERTGDRLTDLREWVCAIETGARIPCGGTHVASMDQLRGVQIRLRRRELDGAVGITMETSTGARR